MKKPLFNKVTVIGVGLIGGSLGMAIKKKGLARWVVGVVRRKRSAIQAVRKKAVDVATFDLKSSVEDADLVVLCAPVSTILKQIPLVRRHLKKNALVIDVGSSKVKIETAARERLKRNVFVGCHPMAGSAHTGIEFADAELFRKAQCFLTKPNPKIVAFWKALGANPVVLNAKLHDAWVARASYLPHLLAFSLFQKSSLGKFPGKLKALNPSAQEFARLAASDAALWADILLSNEESANALSDLEKSLHQLKQALKTNNRKALQEFIQKANRVSQKLVPDHSR